MIIFGQLTIHSELPTDVGANVTVTDSNGNSTTGTIGSDGFCILKLPAFQLYTIAVSNGYISKPISMGCGENHYVEVGLGVNNPLAIKAILNAELETEYFEVGDQVIFKENETEVRFDVLEIDYRMGKYGRNIIFGRHDLLTSMQMQTTNTNAGGYGNTLVARYLDGEYYDNLDSDLQSVIKLYDFQASQGSQTSALKNEEHKVWLPVEFNIFGGTTYAAATERTGGNAEQFSFFATAQNRIKNLNGAVASWWEASPYVSNSTNFCYVGTTGGPNNNGASASLGVLPCFMIAAD